MFKHLIFVTSPKEYKPDDIKRRKGEAYLIYKGDAARIVFRVG